MGWKEQLPWVVRPLGILPTTWRERGRVWWYATRDLPRTIREDATVEMAAGMTFFLLFSLFPGLLFLVTLLPYLPLETHMDMFFDPVRPLLPVEVYTLLHTHVEDLLTEPRGGLLTASAAIALFSASRALVSLSRALNRAYRVPVLRSELWRRLRSMLLTMSALGVIILAVLTLSLGDRVVALIVEKGYLRVEKAILINAVRWPVLLILSSFLVQQLYFLLPDVRPRWRLITSGSLLAVLGWVVATWGFTSFASRFVEFNATYGSLGTAAIVMAWLYLGCFTLMLGGSFNALVERGLPPDVAVKMAAAAAGRAARKAEEATGQLQTVADRTQDESRGE
jgi:membrane protein